MDNVFLITLGFIFTSALIGIYAKRRRRDRCLKDFDAFQVTVELKDGKLVWGRLAVFPNGIELFYAQPNRSEGGHFETSYVMFQAQMDTIQAIYRYHDELTTRRKEQRLLEIERAYRPNLPRRTWRWLRNFLNTFSDAFNQSIGTVIAQAKKSDNASVVKTQDKHIQEIGSTVLGAVGNAYEPILERYIGRKVVIEELRNKEWVEHAGILKEYTAGWVELLDCRSVEEHVFQFSEPDRLALNRDIDFVVRRDDAPVGARLQFTIEVQNHGEEEVIVSRVEAPGAYESAIGVRLGPGQKCTKRLEELPDEALEGLDPDRVPKEVSFLAAARAGEVAIDADRAALPDVRLFVRACRDVDRVIPRSHAILRHGGEPLESWYEKLRRRSMDDRSN